MSRIKTEQSKKCSMWAHVLRQKLRQLETPAIYLRAQIVKILKSTPKQDISRPVWNLWANGGL